MDPSARQHILGNTGRIASWFGVVLFLPWASFFVIGRVGRMDSNLAGAVLVVGYTALEMLLLAWLFHWSISGATEWTFMVFGGLLVLDNTDWHPHTAADLRAAGFLQVDFNGFGPLNAYAWTTSLFLRADTRLQRGWRPPQPVGGIQQVDPEND